MAFKHGRLGEWLEEQAPGERVVSYLVSSNVGAASFAIRAGDGPPVWVDGPQAGPQRRAYLAHELGLDADLGLPGVGTTFHLLTDRQLILGSRSAARNRPKDLVHAAPREGTRLHWFDAEAGTGNLHRQFITVYSDGRWRSDFTGLVALGRRLTASNADGWLEAVTAAGIELVEH